MKIARTGFETTGYWDPSQTLGPVGNKDNNPLLTNRQPTLVSVYGRAGRQIRPHGGDQSLRWLPGSIAPRESVAGGFGITGRVAWQSVSSISTYLHMLACWWETGGPLYFLCVRGNSQLLIGKTTSNVPADVTVYSIFSGSDVPIDLAYVTLDPLTYMLPGEWYPFSVLVNSAGMYCTWNNVAVQYLFAKSWNLNDMALPGEQVVPTSVTSTFRKGYYDDIAINDLTGAVSNDLPPFIRGVNVTPTISAPGSWVNSAALLDSNLATKASPDGVLVMDLPSPPVDAAEVEGVNIAIRSAVAEGASPTLAATLSDGVSSSDERSVLVGAVSRDYGIAQTFGKSDGSSWSTAEWEDVQITLDAQF